jgi:hypothetical protein
MIIRKVKKSDGSREFQVLSTEGGIKLAAFATSKEAEEFKTTEQKKFDEKLAKAKEHTIELANGAKTKRTKKAKEVDNRVITVLAEKNPKRPGSKAHKAFSQYKDGMTVSEYQKLGPYPAGYIKYDVKHTYIKVQ